MVQLSVLLRSQAVITRFEAHRRDVFVTPKVGAMLVALWTAILF